MCRRGLAGAAPDWPLTAPRSHTTSRDASRRPGQTAACLFTLELETPLSHLTLTPVPVTSRCSPACLCLSYSGQKDSCLVLPAEFSSFSGLPSSRHGTLVLTWRSPAMLQGPLGGQGTTGGPTGHWREAPCDTQQPRSFLRFSSTRVGAAPSHLSTILKIHWDGPAGTQPSCHTQGDEH